MQSFDPVKEYCDKVREQIRWKKAKSVLAAEIEDHLCDQRDAYMSSGDDENLATQKAIAQMGDAVLVGQELDKTHRPKAQRLMLILTGVFMLLGAGINYIIGISINSQHEFHVLPYALAFVVFLCCYYMDFSVLGKHPKKIYGAVLAVSVMAVLLATPVNGRLIWLRGGFAVSLQYLSLIFPMVYALFVYSMREKGLRGILLSEAAYLPLALLLLAVPSLSGFVLYSAASIAILCFSVCRGWFCVNKKQGLLVVLLPAFAAGAALVFTMPYVLYYRLSMVLNPAQDRLGAGYLYCFIRDVLSEAAFFGKGDVPQYAQSITVLPDISTDFSLVFLIHRFGFIALLGIVLLIGIFCTAGVGKALQEKSVLGSLIALAVMLTFTLQAVCYIASNLGYGFIVSMSLPFISYGNCALFINSALIGFMLSVFRTGEFVQDVSVKSASKSNRAIFSYEDGKLIINFK